MQSHDMPFSPPLTLLDFFKAVLPSEGIKIWTSITQDKIARNHFCNSLEELADQILANDARGIDTYHACASYKTDCNRRASNVLYAQSLWRDIDIGEGKPYATLETAIQDVVRFTRECSLPLPHIVGSGYGTHLYWPLEQPLGVLDWQQLAETFNRLTTTHGLHADPSRSRDIASILRSPGTHNYKFPESPKPVLWRPSSEIAAGGIPAETLLKACNSIHTENKTFTEGRAQSATGASKSANNNLTAGIGRAFDPTVGVAQGSRGSTLLRYAGELVAKGFSIEDVLAKCLVWNQLCMPPQDEKEVRRIVASALTMHAQNHPDTMIWSEPLPLTAKLKARPYPLEALPDTIRNAVVEVHSFVKAPIALIVSSALGAVSLAVQSYIDVERAKKLTGPTGLFFLTIADSGERKSTCDKYFMSSIQDYEKQQEELAKPKRKDYQAKLRAWEAKRSGLGDAIRRHTNKGQDTKALENRLVEHEKEKPIPPIIPRLIYSDATPEALTWNLAKVWPSGGVISSEGGIVFGAHGMNKETIMRNLSTLNILWDGGTYQSDRKSVESYSLRGARLTMALQLQETTLRSFFEQSKGQARGSGFLARFLVAHPDSTQGSRPFTEPPSSWPYLYAFDHRITEILKLPAPVAADGSLSPIILSLTDEAKAVWVKFHNEIENELHSGGELYEVRDVASKITDNAARLAALFHYFENGAGAIGLKHMESACRIVRWHLYEAQRFFGEIALPAEVITAERLDRWLLDKCRKKHTGFIPFREAQQYGPVRILKPLSEALKILSELGRARVLMDGKRKEIHVNPALLMAAT